MDVEYLCFFFSSRASDFQAAKFWTSFFSFFGKKKVLKVPILFFVMILAPTHNQTSWLESRESHTRFGFWEWLWFEPGDGRNPVKMQPTPLRGQYKTRTGWKHFPNFFFCAQSCDAVFYSLNILIPLNTLCAGFSRVLALACCCFSGRITQLTA